MNCNWWERPALDAACHKIIKFAHYVCMSLYKVTVKLYIITAIYNICMPPFCI